MKNKKAFTLMEIVVAIVIVGIIGTLGFIQYIFYNGEARDSIRIKDISNISELLEVNILNGKKLPFPDGAVETEEVEIRGIEGIKWNKGYFGENSYEQIKSLSDIPKEPTEESLNYNYYLSTDGKYYYLEVILESDEKYIKTNYIPSKKTSFLNNSNNYNRPVINSITGHNQTSTINENSQINLTINASIGDRNKLPLTYKAYNLPSGLSINGNNVTGTISGSGDYKIVFYALDNSLTISEGYPFTIKVGDSGTPVINSISGETIVAKGTSLDLTINGNNLPGTTYSIEGLESGTNIKVSGNKIIGTSKTPRTLTFKVIAILGTKKSTPKTITVKFTDIANRAPIINGVTGETTKFTGQQIDLTINATDPDSDPLMYTAQGLPNGLSISGNRITGTSNVAGNFQFSIDVTDGKLSAERNVSVQFNSNKRTCNISNGVGEQILKSDGIYGVCRVKTCNTGYVLAPSGKSCILQCDNPIYLDGNGVTVKAAECAVGGREYNLNGTNYYVAINRRDLINKINSNYPLNRIVTSKLTNMSSIFYNVTNFNQPIGNWDTSNVTDMDSMFYGASSFNQDISEWDTSKVERMGSMFYGASSFNQNISKWNTSNVTNMSHMFISASLFNQPIGNWNTSKVKYMAYMFYGAKKFNQPIGDWDTSNLKNMSSMFYGATNFNQPIGNWNTGNVTTMDSMFYSATNFNQSIGNWDTSNVINMSSMFNGATNFNQSIGSWNTSKVKNMDSMFREATNFNQSIGNWDTSNVKNMESMFRKATNFNQAIGNWNTGNVTTMDSMFYGATNFNQSIGSWNTGNVTDMSSMFREATNFNQSIGSWNTSKVTNMLYMFSEAENFNQPIGNWDTSNVKNMIMMFYGGYGKYSFNQPLNNWNVSNVTNMQSMFTGAKKFNQPLNNWNVSNVINMDSMFSRAINFNQPLNTWNVSNVINMDSMFKEAINFNQEIGSWDTSKVKDMRYMFFGATSFNKNLSNWNTKSIRNCYSFGPHLPNSNKPNRCN